MVVALARPSLLEHRPTWQTLGQSDKPEIEGLTFKEPAYHIVNLKPLPTTANRELMAEILQKVTDIPEKLFNLVAGRAEGNPFYMEELVKMSIDDGVIVLDETAWRVDMAQFDEDHIPGTLTGVLQARLDKLAADERVMLKRASVVGRVFWDTAVQQISDDPNLFQLGQLQNRELIYQQSESAFISTRQYLFKHDLLREVTYQTVLKKVRCIYHENVAKWLVQVAEANDRLDEYAGIVGEHYHMAEKQNKAAYWYGHAGQNAVTHYAHAVTIQLLRHRVLYQF